MVTNHTSSELARQFLALHHGPKPLILPNVWDVASARIFEEAGFPAGRHHERRHRQQSGLPGWPENLSRRDARGGAPHRPDAVNIPVTADMESGYGASPEEIAETAREVLAAGAVGMNLEDTSGAHPPSLADLSLQTRLHQRRSRGGGKGRSPVPPECAHRYFPCGARPRGNSPGTDHRAPERLRRCRSALPVRSRREG